MDVVKSCKPVHVVRAPTSHQQHHEAGSRFLSRNRDPLPFSAVLSHPHSLSLDVCPPASLTSPHCSLAPLPSWYPSSQLWGLLPSLTVGKQGLSLKSLRTQVSLCPVTEPGL